MVNTTIQSLDLNLLKVFDALLEDRHVSRAAQRVGLSQPALSNALSRLRAVFGDPLFVRTGQGMKPTARALQLAGPLRTGLAQIRAAVEGGPGFDAISSTRVFRVAMPDYLEFRLLPPLLVRLAEVAPHVRVQVRRLDGLFQAPEAALRSGNLDAAIGYFPDARGLEPGTLSETLFTDEQAVVARKGNPVFNGNTAARLTNEQFSEAEHAAVIFRDEAWGVIDTELASRGLRRKLRLATPHFLTVIHAVLETDLVACIPIWLARHFEPMGLTIRQPPFQLPYFTARWIWNQNADADPGHKWFRQTSFAALPRA